MSTISTLFSSSGSRSMNASEDTVRGGPSGYQYSCSFCHNIFDPEPSFSPFLAGTETDKEGARHACSPCQRAITSLSACWTCGTALYRGADAVSFGWTFWCRSCYACAFCRYPLSIPSESRETGRLRRLPVCKLCQRDCCSSAAGDALRPSPDVSFVDLFDPRAGPAWKCRDSLKKIPLFMAQRLGACADAARRPSIAALSSDNASSALSPANAALDDPLNTPRYSIARTDEMEPLNQFRPRATDSDRRSVSNPSQQQTYYSPSFQHPRRALVPSIDTSTLTSAASLALLPKTPVLPPPPSTIRLTPVVKRRTILDSPPSFDASHSTGHHASAEQSSKRMGRRRSRQMDDAECAKSPGTSIYSASTTTTTSRALPKGMFLAPLTDTEIITHRSDTAKYKDPSQLLGRRQRTVLQSVEMYEMIAPGDNR